MVHSSCPESDKGRETLSKLALSSLCKGGGLSSSSCFVSSCPFRVLRLSCLASLTYLASPLVCLVSVLRRYRLTTVFYRTWTSKLSEVGGSLLNLICQRRC